MPETNIKTNIPAKVKFTQYHQPGLQDGEYQIDIAQTIQSTNGRISQATYSQTLKFAVFGERFSINPQEIQAVFPPQGSLGEHSNVLSHVIVNCSTLPWERSAIVGRKDLPWLVLLVFDESEKPQPQVLTLAELQQTPAKQFPSFNLEAAQHPEDKVTVIDVPKSLLKQIMPSTEDLALMAHIRQGLDANDKPMGEEFAVIFANRLPLPGRKAIAHLVSVENRYTKTAGFKLSGMGETIRLVTLKTWWFSCTDENECFEQLLINLNRNPQTLRLPHNSNRDAERYLSAGYVPLPHNTIKGEQIVSWYRSPLIPGEQSTQQIYLPARCSEELLRYNPHNKLVDVSYAAAWELGRLLTLQSKQVSVELFKWKRHHVQQLKQREQQLLHLPLQPVLTDATQTTSATTVDNWFRDLSLLKWIPFDYLVPDETMLPVESIRFFQVDSQWVDCLLDGAFSIGRVTNLDHKQDRQLNHIQPQSSDNLSGFLMRSDVVFGWSHLEVDCDESSELLRMERLSSHVLLCLFSGTPTKINIHLRPEKLHFGVEEIAVGQYQKRGRDVQGNINDSAVTIPWKGEVKARTINLSQLAKDLGNISSSAQFALQMIEGVPKVSFTVAL